MTVNLSSATVLVGSAGSTFIAPVTSAKLSSARDGDAWRWTDDACRHWKLGNACAANCRTFR